MSSEVAPARAAATIVVARPGAEEGQVEVLVLRRSAIHRFAPGFVVFPGGSVDSGDDELAERWFGTREERARACAVRELAEEAGLRVTNDGVKGGAPDELYEPGMPRIPVDRLREIGHWIAPDFLPMRFDARFYATDVPRGVEPVADAREADEVWWSRPSDLLEQHRTGDALLAWPTFKTLEALATCRTVADVLALRIEQVPPPLASHVAPRPGEEA
jgi:8-oxo-dGTP pyrophosphatase MutT (NUDIX family)